MNKTKQKHIIENDLKQKTKDKKDEKAFLKKNKRFDGKRRQFTTDTKKVVTNKFLCIVLLHICRYLQTRFWTSRNCFGQEQNRISIWSSSKNNCSLLNFSFESLFWTS